MYVPDAFSERRPSVLCDVMRDHPLATLIVSDGMDLEVNHLPLFLETGGDGPGALHGHVARANPLWRQCGARVLAIFHGPDAYVSPGWYPSKAATGRVVPTWNYVVVHARGRLCAMEDPVWLRRHLEAVSCHFEAAMPHPWKLDDAPAAFIEQAASAIVGIEIRLDSLEGKFKLSQNRGDADRNGVMAGLRGEGPGAVELAAFMEGYFAGGRR